MEPRHGQQMILQVGTNFNFLSVGLHPIFGNQTPNLEIGDFSTVFP